MILQISTAFNKINPKHMSVGIANWPMVKQMRMLFSQPVYALAPIMKNFELT